MNELRMLIVAVVCSSPSLVAAEETPWTLDERPAAAQEWGFRPADGLPVQITPPGFVWRPQDGADSYHLQVARDPDVGDVAYEAAEIDLYCHAPPEPLLPGTYYWRFRAVSPQKGASAWSGIRSFEITTQARPLPLPRREDLLRRVPSEHPRLLLRPEEVPRLRSLAETTMKDAYQGMVVQCERLLKDPPPTAEPPRYPPEVQTKSEEWRTIWWGNRVYTINVLESASTLAFTRLLGGRDEYGQLARRLLLDAAEWDPKGATGFRYNDEAGMPYAYHFSRAYSFLNDLLTEEDRKKCREVMQIRGREMHQVLHPRHIWRPYGSHANRSWHFLGEVGIAFLNEIPEAGDWLWFAMNVFYNAYPVWCDDDGGWHEGVAYWRSYMARFTWWADVMRAAMDIDAYVKPYFSQIGYYPMYLQPPGTRGGGFGDQAAGADSRGNVPLMQILAAHAGNPHWQWYVEAHGEPRTASGAIGFLRGALPRVPARSPTELPSSRCFVGTGQAFLNSNLLDGTRNVSVLFKSSPFGTQSHGYDANNAFMLYAFGEPLLISSGLRDIHGSEHHQQWMWQTKSVNSITVNGQGQIPHSASARGEIVAFETSPGFDFVAGEAGPSYGELLNRFTRSILFVKPEVIVVYDQLEAPEPATFDWWLHSPVEMQIDQGRQQARVVGKRAGCEVTFLAPQGLAITQTDQFDPPPRPRVKLVQYHLTASTVEPSKTGTFITVIRPFESETSLPGQPALVAVDGGWALEAELISGRLIVLLRSDEPADLAYGSVSTDGEVAAVRFNKEGRSVEQFRQGGTRVDIRPGR